MVCRGHAKEIVGLLNVNCIYLNILFDGRSKEDVLIYTVYI
jgi:hypothetical protein